MVEPIRERDIVISPELTEVAVRDYQGRIEFYGELGEYPGYDKLRWRTFKFENVPASERDGALIEIDSGGRTPVELVVADKVFSEVPLEGQLIFLHLNPEGKISAYRFDSSNGSPFLFEAGPDEIFCWIAPEQEGPAKVLEYEEPGFTESDLKLVDEGAKEVSGISIPDEFWTMLELIETGETENLPIPITDLNSLR